MTSYRVTDLTTRCSTMIVKANSNLEAAQKAAVKAGYDAADVETTEYRLDFRVRTGGNHLTITAWEVLDGGAS